MKKLRIIVSDGEKALSDENLTDKNKVRLELSEKIKAITFSYVPDMDALVIFLSERK